MIQIYLILRKCFGITCLWPEREEVRKIERERPGEREVDIHIFLAMLFHISALENLFVLLSTDVISKLLCATFHFLLPNLDQKTLSGDKAKNCG